MTDTQVEQHGPVAAADDFVPTVTSTGRRPGSDETPRTSDETPRTTAQTTPQTSQTSQTSQNPRTSEAPHAPQAPRPGLSRAAIEMMTRLPHPMLRFTAEHFPHIVDRLAAEWADPARMARAIDDLIYDMRGGRAGFPMDVLSELGVLRERYERWVGPGSQR